MKTNFFFIIALLWSSMLFGQWSITGNNGINVTNNFLGTLDDADLRFRTDNLFRMHLDGTTGFLGLNTTTPLMRFHVLDGGILSSGTTGTNPDMGAGTRLMWIPEMAAFRAGRVGVGGGNAGWWDGTNVGI